MASGVYDTGTITLTNGSATVTGSGTSWVGNISAGNVLITDGGAVYPIEKLVSATEITLSRPFTGSGGSGASYEIVPTGGVAQALTARINTLISSFQSVVDEAGQGKFPDGSGSQPGVRFTSDEDTGIRRTGSNKGALVAGGIDVFPFEAKNSGSMIQTDATDTTSGRLMTVGAFGLGGNGVDVSPAELEDVSGSGLFTLTAGISGVLDAGSSVLHLSRSSTSAVQVGFRRAKDICHVRRKQAGVWQDWREVYHQRSIVGPVGESGGVPTGAVIERGSNSNGEYVRFADGTQICTNGNSAITSNPAAFVGTVTSVDGDKLRIGRWF